MGRNRCAEFVAPFGAMNRLEDCRPPRQPGARVDNRQRARLRLLRRGRAVALEMTSERWRADTGGLIRAMPGAGIFRASHQASTTVTADLSNRPPGGRFPHGALRSRGLDAQDQARPCAPVSWAVFRPACRARRSAPAEARVQFPLSRCISRDSTAPVRWWLGHRQAARAAATPLPDRASEWRTLPRWKHPGRDSSEHFPTVHPPGSLAAEASSLPLHPGILIPPMHPPIQRRQHQQRQRGR